MTFLNALRSRHVIVALLVAPLLAVGAWFAVGYWVAGDAMTPAPATAGNDYPLLERSGCRYAGGRCVLANGDLEIGVSLQGTRLLLAPSVDVDAVMAGLAGSSDAPPVAAVWREPGQHWEVSLPSQPSSSDRIRLVVSRQGSQFYGELSLAFTASEGQ